MAWNPFKKNGDQQMSSNLPIGGNGSSLNQPSQDPSMGGHGGFSQASEGQLNTSPIRLAKRIGDIFYATGKIDEYDIEEAHRLSQTEGLLIGRALISMGKLSEADVQNSLDQQKLVTSVDIGRLRIDPAVTSVVPISLVIAHSFLPFDVIGDLVCVCAKSVLSFDAMKAVKDFTRLNVRLFDSLEGWQALNDCIEVYYPVSE